MATVTRGGNLPDTGVTKNEVYAMVDNATVTGIVNADIASNAAIDPSKIAGGVSSSVRGTFVNADLSTGILTITHSKALSAPYSMSVRIFDNNNLEVISDSVTGATNTTVVSLLSYGTLTGTWGYVYIA